MTEKKSASQITQIMAGSLAAITAAFLGSRLGVAGTVAGAGLAAAVTSGGTAIYQHSLDRTSRTLHDKLAARHQPTPGVAVQDAPTVPLVLSEKATEAPAARRKLTWKVAAISTAGMFLVALAVITLVELGLGRPVSGGNEGTTLSGLVGAATSHKETPTTTTVPETTRETYTRTQEATTDSPTPDTSARETQTSTTQEPTTTTTPETTIAPAPTTQATVTQIAPTTR